MIQMGQVAAQENQHTAYDTFAGSRRRLNLKGWHSVLSHTDPAAITHLKKRGLMEITDATIAPETKGSVTKECKSLAPSYGRGGRSPKTLIEIVHTDIEGPFRANLMGFKCFQVSLMR